MTNARKNKAAWSRRFMVALLFGLLIVAAVPALAQTDDKATKTETAGIKPNLQIKIPTVKFSDLPIQTEGEKRFIDVPWLAQYISGVYKYGVAIGAFLAAIMVIVGGFIYLTSGDSGRTQQAKTIITDAILGLAVLLGSYTILYTVNPNLTTLTALRVEVAKRVEFEGVEFISDEAYRQATGKSRLPKESILKLGRQVAQEQGIDPCLFESIVVKESGGNPGAIGHDENVPRLGVGARRAFITSGKKYSGETFQTYPPGSAEWKKLVTDSSLRNDDAFDPNKPPDFGLDTRFSHGFGLGQQTAGTKNMPWCRNSKGHLGVQRSGKCYSVLELLDPKINLTVSAKLVKSKINGCGGEDNHRCIFYRYAGSGCSARVSVCHKSHEYAKCTGDPSKAAKELPYARCTEWNKESTANCNNLDYVLK